MENWLTGRVAVITGGSRGIGKATAEAMAKSGASVAIISSKGGSVPESVCAALNAEGAKALGYACDVSDYQAVKAVVGKIIEDFGGIDILVNNAGIVKDGLMLRMSESDFDDVIRVNLKGAFNMTRHVSEHFLKRRYGRIINITSVSGMMGNPGQANYAASKAGLIGLTKTTAKELASRKITCNAIAPGFTKTDMTNGIEEKALTMIPLGRMGEANEIADLAVFLASDRASYITGEIIKVDGGLYI